MPSWNTGQYQLSRVSGRSVEVGVEDTPGLKLKADIAIVPEPDLFSAGIAVRHAGLAQDRVLVKDFGAVENWAR